MNLSDYLTNSRNYQDLFERFKKKSQKNSYSRNATRNSGLSLNWIIVNQKLVTKHIIKEINDKSFKPSYATKNIVEADKKRTIYTLSWPSKIVETLISTYIDKVFSDHYSEDLYSFRKGRSNLLALGNLSKFLKSNKDSPVYIYKTDISQYGESIDVKQLHGDLRVILENEGSYIGDLVKYYLQPCYVEDSKVKKIKNGLAAGFSLTPVCENIYLMDLDKKIKSDNILYIRFGDDILIASRSYNEINSAISILEKEAIKRKLNINPSKTSRIVFNKQNSQDNFVVRSKVDYLGYSINSSGDLFLSDNKIYKFKLYIKNKLSIAHSVALKHTKDQDQIIKSLINCIVLGLKSEFTHPYLQLILLNCNDINEIQKLDKFIAKQILRLVFKKGGDRVFKKYSYKKLRDNGLPSINHIKNINFKKC